MRLRVPDTEGNLHKLRNKAFWKIGKILKLNLAGILSRIFIGNSKDFVGISNDFIYICHPFVMQFVKLP